MKNSLSLRQACLLVCFSIAVLLSGCMKKVTNADGAFGNVTIPRGVTPYSFNWETVDWMPTPPGQSQIPPPWIGQGSLSSTYGLDVVNDHKHSDGWELVYNTFDPNASGPLPNPYFMLYNRYRGLVRIYLYTTTPFVASSTYIVDGLNVISNKTTTMLNFLGTDLVDASNTQSTFSQVEPAPTDGSQPLATNKWYMLQYEIAYDPQINSSLSYSDIQLGWFTNYNSVSTISLGGTLTGTIKGTVGAPSSALGAALTKGGQVAGTGVLSVAGKAILDNNQTDTNGNNTLGLPAFAFKALTKGISAALSGAAGDVPGAISGIFSAIFGGSSGGQTVNLNLNASITLNGTETTKGSFPSSPTSVYVPGTNITAAAQNYTPLYTKPLGIFNLTSRSTVDIIANLTPDQEGYFEFEFVLDNGLAGLPFVINPAVSGDGTNGATIANFNALIMVIDPIIPAQSIYNTPEIIGTHFVIPQTLDAYDEMQRLIIFYSEPNPPVPTTVAVRISFDVIPFNGAPKTSIVKTFLANTKLIVR
jgi:hypothetical protein